MTLGSKFMFATGIENSYPTILLPDGTIKRIDEMEKCCHNPGRSTNFKSTISVWFSLANASTSFGFIPRGLLFG